MVDPGFPRLGGANSNVKPIITARNEVGARLYFDRLCDSVHGGTAADGTHPTGMHSCSAKVLPKNE